MRYWSIVNFLVLSLLLLSCSKPWVSRVDDAQLIGLYKSHSDVLGDAAVPYFFITANLDLYSFQNHDGQLVRDYIGTISYDPGLRRVTYEYQPESQQFRSGDFEGKRTGDFPSDNLTVLNQVNQRTLQLKLALGEEFPTELRLKQNKPAYTRDILPLLELLIENVESLKRFLKTKSLKRVWVSDSDINEVFIQEDRLVIVTKPDKSPESVLDQLNNDPDSIRSYE